MSRKSSNSCIKTFSFEPGAPPRIPPGLRPESRRGFAPDPAGASPQTPPRLRPGPRWGSAPGPAGGTIVPPDPPCKGAWFLPTQVFWRRGEESGDSGPFVHTRRVEKASFRTLRHEAFSRRKRFLPRFSPSCSRRQAVTAVFLTLTDVGMNASTSRAPRMSEAAMMYSAAEGSSEKALAQMGTFGPT